jgi:cardiolipin synthase A/B
MEALVTSPVRATSSSTFRWLRTGEEALGAMLAAIHGAQESIRLETYIYHTGQTGEKFREALTQACQRGVKVQVLADAFGSANLPNTFWDSFVKAGGQFAWFNPLCLNRWCYRDHRKMVVCDNATAFIGGFNVADEYHGDGVTRGWRDLGLQITGEPVKELAESFDGFFARASFAHKRLQQLRKARTQVATGHNWQLLLSGPGRNDGSLKQTLARDLQKAQSVKIISAYFLPTWRLRKELMRVARRGGQVQLILAGKSDVGLSQLASRRLYKSFLRAGVQIFEYAPQILHAKLFVFDDVVYVGSANLDTRSLRINYELSLRISDAKVAAEAREIFVNDLQHCRRIDAETWRKSRSLWSKLREDWAYFILARVDPYLARRQLKTLR